MAVYDLDYSDLMLYMATMALEGVCQRIEVDDKILQPIEKWFANEIWTEQESYESGVEVRSVVEAGMNIPGLLKLLFNLTGRITGGHKSVKEIRHSLKRNPHELIRRINELYDKLRTMLKNSNLQSEIVLIVDSLDRIPPDIMDDAFRKWSDLFKQLNIHLIITVPLSLIYSPQGEPLFESNFSPFIIPMPKIRLKEHSWDEYWPKGVNALVKIIQNRVEQDKVFAGDSEGQHRCMRELALASGGSLRELMRLLLVSADEAWDVPIDPEHIERAIRKVSAEFMNHFRYDDIPVLREIHRLKRADHRPEGGRQLFYRFALEYNGDKWADVHPLVFYSDIYNDEKILREIDEA